MSDSSAETFHRFDLIGMVVPYGGKLDREHLEQLRREGWLLCNGSSHPDAVYPTLSRLIKGIYGTGDTSNEFRLPDLRNRIVLGASEDRPLGTTGGSEEVTLKVEHLPPHSHTYLQPHERGDEVERVAKETAQSNEAIRRLNALTGNGEGQSAAFSIVQPFLAMNFLIRSGVPTNI